MDSFSEFYVTFSWHHFFGLLNISESTLVVIRNSTNAVMCYLAIIICFLMRVNKTKRTKTAHTALLWEQHNTVPHLADGPRPQDAADCGSSGFFARWRWPSTERRTAALPPYLLRWHCTSDHCKISRPSTTIQFLLVMKKWEGARGRDKGVCAF